MHLKTNTYTQKAINIHALQQQKPYHSVRVCKIEKENNNKTRRNVHGWVFSAYVSRMLRRKLLMLLFFSFFLSACYYPSLFFFVSVHVCCCRYFFSHANSSHIHL